MSERARTVVGLVISITLLGLLLLVVPIDELVTTVLSANGWLVLALVAVHAVMLLARVQRFALLVNERGVASRSAFDAVFIGWFANLTLPAKAGELARPAVYARGSGMPLAGAVAAVIIERLVDLCCLAALFYWVTTFGVPEGLPTWIGIAAPVAGGIAVLGLLILGVLARQGAFPAFRQGLRAVGGPRLLTAAGWSALIWALEVFGAWLAIAAIGPLPPGALDASAVLIVATTLAVAAPAGPGGLGVEQWVTLLVLAAWGIGSVPAVSISVLMFFAAAVLVAPIGLASIARAAKNPPASLEGERE